MKKAILTALLVLVALTGGYEIGQRMAHNAPDTTMVGGAGDDGASSEPEILYWVAPMDPNYRRDEPGKSPMGMDLVPVYASEAAPEGGVRISPTVQNNLGVRTAVATVRPLWRRVEATGYVGFDETRISHIHLRTEGWIVRLAVNAEGERVRKGDLLFELYSPELVNAQKEYLQAVQRGDDRLRRGGDEKLRALGMVRAEIEALAGKGRASENIQVLAPQDGVVSALNAREGMYVQPNTRVMSLADLSTVWMQAEVFESQAEWVAEGQAAEARLAYLPGEVFSGRVDYVYPVLDPISRTLRVRLRFDNPGELLKPNMYARVTIFGRLQPSALVIPKEALIRAPTNDRVVVALGDGRFDVHEVLAGIESGGWVEIIAGIEEGNRVVASAQFLIDSEASLAGSIRRLEDVPEIGRQARRSEVFGSGTVNTVDRRDRKLNISHGPIDELGWPSMTMEFDVDPGADLAGIESGDEVQFALRQEHAGHWVIREVAGQEDWVDISPPELRNGELRTDREPASAAGEGRIISLEVKAGKLRIEHEPIAELDWPAMTMDFRVTAGVDLDRLEAGERIHFLMREDPDGGWIVTEIHRVPDAPAAGDQDHG